jgi:hypothetical protein
MFIAPPFNSLSAVGGKVVVTVQSNRRSIIFSFFKPHNSLDHAMQVVVQVKESIYLR